VPQGGDFTVEDSFSLALQYQSGVLQNHTHSWAYPGFLAQIELLSDELHLTLDLGKGSLNGTIGEEQVSFAAEDQLYRAELVAFAEAIRTGNRGLVRSTYADSIESLRSALSAVQAVETGTVELITRGR
jgi:predicted dehydrogenase